MLSKGHIKLIQALQNKKQRYKQGLFIVENQKIIEEILNSDVKVKTIFTTDQNAFTNYDLYSDQLHVITGKELQSITSLNTAGNALGIFEIPTIKKAESQLALFLDQIQDPGNLGTIIRLADWYGIEKVYCRLGTVDIYNPKVLQSSMGSFLRVELEYINDLESFFQNTSKTIYGTFMNGQNIHSTDIESEGIIVIGNEGNGISSEVEAFIQQRLAIPNFGNAESLNAAIATGIVLDNFKRS